MFPKTITIKSLSDKSNPSGLFRYLLLFLIIACACISLLDIFCSIYTGKFLNQVAGAWIGTAIDFSEGIFYRPLYSEAIGYGGSRYFPLIFSLHALLIKIFSMPIASGHIVSILSGTLLIGICFFLLRRMKVNFILCFGLIVLLCSTSSIQLGIAGMRGDILPLALNLLGFSFFLSRYPQQYRMIISSICFTLAFSGKVTALNGIVSLFIWLMLDGKKKEAFTILLYTSLGFIIVLCILYFGTSGRIITIFRYCASGGADLYTILKSPVTMTSVMTERDPMCLLLLFWATVAMCRFRRSYFSNLFFIYLSVTILYTIVLFGSPGIDYNHLVDSAAASILFIGSTENDSTSENIRQSACVLTFLIIFSLMYRLPFLKDTIKGETSIAVRYSDEIINLIKPDHIKVLSEDNMLPILANKSIYLLDSYMIRLLIHHDATIRSALFESISRKKFDYIIFYMDPLEKKQWYSEAHFGNDFIKTVLDNYKKSRNDKYHVIYVPQ